MRKKVLLSLATNFVANSFGPSQETNRKLASLQMAQYFCHKITKIHVAKPQKKGMNKATWGHAWHSGCLWAGEASARRVLKLCRRKYRCLLQAGFLCTDWQTDFQLKQLDASAGGCSGLSQFGTEYGGEGEGEEDSSVPCMAQGRAQYEQQVRVNKEVTCMTNSTKDKN